MESIIDARCLNNKGCDLMPRSKYESIYKDLKLKIEDGTYEYQKLLPSEHELIRIYDCSRNTVRRALANLVSDGYVQTLQGKGVRCIFRPVEQTSYTIGSIESFKESSIRNHQTGSTRVLQFMELTADQKISDRTGFAPGSELVYIQRVHLLDNLPLIINHNYFLKSTVPGLTPDIAEASIYDYIENTLHMTIVNSKRVITVEKITEIDEKYLHLNVQDYNCMAVISSHTYNSDGIMFEFTQSRHRPDYFRFYDNAVRKPSQGI